MRVLLIVTALLPTDNLQAAGRFMCSEKINVSELSTNQVLARAVVNSNGNILMYEGARIRKENIQKLIKK